MMWSLKTRTNSHYKLLLDLWLVLMALRAGRGLSLWTVVSLVSYFDVYDPFLHSRDNSHLRRPVKSAEKD